jgi:hypothetical protein
MMNKLLKEKLLKRKKIEGSLSNIIADLESLYSSTRIPCSHCGKRQKISELDLYRIYWKQIVAEYQYICIGCKWVNRILFNSVVEEYRKHMMLLEMTYFRHRHMKDVWHDTDEPSRKYKFVNNFYIEKLIDEEIVFQEKM